jgi:anti-sigma B factor antagonist
MAMNTPANAALLDVEVAEDRGVLNLRGELCLSTAELVRKPLFSAIENGSTNVVLDLTECTFIDSSGLEVLALASWRLAAIDPRRELIVVSPRSAVRRILDLTGMDHIVTVRDQRPQGDGATQAQQTRALAQDLATR